MSDLSDLFKLASQEKKKKREEIDSILGDSFERLFIEQIESENKPKSKTKENSVKNLEKKLLLLKDASYSTIDKLMRSICSEFNITPKKLHKDFVNKNGVTPDEWIKNKRKSIKEEVIKQPTLLERSLGLLAEPSQTNNSDTLTPINKNYATLDDLQKQYKIFLERIQQQLSTLGGGGETRLEFLDDVSRDLSKIDNKYLKYDAFTNKWVGDNPFATYATTLVTTSTYTITENDDYIGVNFEGPVTIILPSSVSNGRMFIVKDERGEASKGTNRYITILPSGSDTIDGRHRAILAYDYGSLSFIYRNDWRVV